MKIRIPKKENIFETGDSDPVGYYYKSGINIPYIHRLKMVLELLNKEKFDKILEIGYGSGILLPELYSRCKELFAVDIHANTNLVYEMMKREKISANLFVGDVNSLPFSDKIFDCVVCVSVLEHILDLKRPINEIYRVLKKGGIAVFGIPVKNTLMHFAFSILGFNDETIHPSSHLAILEKIKKRFLVEKIIKFPRLTPFSLSLYCSCRARRKNEY